MTTIRTDAERDAEIQDRLHQKGFDPCGCSAACRAYRYQKGTRSCRCGSDACWTYWYLYTRTAAGLRGADLGVPAMGGEAVAATLGYHPDGRSRYASKRGRDAANARRMDKANAASR